MTIEVRVPQLPESVADATIVSWNKKPGDAVARDENLVDLETDKVVLEVPAPAAGVLKEIKLKDGTTVTSGQVLAVIEEGATSAAPAERARPPPGDLQRRRPRPSRPSATAAPDAAAAKAPAEAPMPRQRPSSAPPQSAWSKRTRSTRRPSPGPGRDGRVSKSDVVNYLSARRTPCRWRLLRQRAARRPPVPSAAPRRRARSSACR